MDLLTPLEINKKIAEFRNELNVFHHKHSPSVPCDGQLHEEYFSELMPNAKNWAENINDAWELFEENHEVSIKKMHDTNNTICYQCVFRDSNLNVIGDSAANTAPMAICLAWIKWKENHK